LNEWREFEERVTDELESLDEELSAIAPLRAKLRQTDPDPVELRAAATTLHAFYNGVERLLIYVSRRFDDSIPNSRPRMFHLLVFLDPWQESKQHNTLQQYWRRALPAVLRGLWVPSFFCSSGGGLEPISLLLATA